MKRFKLGDRVYVGRKIEENIATIIHLGGDIECAVQFDNVYTLSGERRGWSLVDNFRVAEVLAMAPYNKNGTGWSVAIRTLSLFERSCEKQLKDFLAYDTPVDEDFKDKVTNYV